MVSPSHGTGRAYAHLSDQGGQHRQQVQLIRGEVGQRHGDEVVVDAVGARREDAQAADPGGRIGDGAIRRDVGDGQIRQHTGIGLRALPHRKGLGSGLQGRIARPLALGGT